MLDYDSLDEETSALKQTEEGEMEDIDDSDQLENISDGLGELSISYERIKDNQFRFNIGNESYRASLMVLPTHLEVFY